MFLEVFAIGAPSVEETGKMEKINDFSISVQLHCSNERVHYLSVLFDGQSYDASGLRPDTVRRPSTTVAPTTGGRLVAAVVSMTVCSFVIYALINVITTCTSTVIVQNIWRHLQALEQFLRTKLERRMLFNSHYLKKNNLIFQNKQIYINFDFFIDWQDEIKCSNTKYLG